MKPNSPAQPNIYFVRHGESIANATGMAAGASESPLTEEGIRQAHAEADIILQKSIQLDVIIASPISRALDTARIIARQTGFDETAIVVTDLLKERTLGSFEGKTQAEFKASTEDEKVSAGSEKLIDLYERVKKANEFIIDVTQGAENVLVVGHSGFYRMARCVAEGLEPEATYTLVQPKNSSLLEYPL